MKKIIACLMLGCLAIACGSAPDPEPTSQSQEELVSGQKPGEAVKPIEGISQEEQPATCTPSYKPCTNNFQCCSRHCENYEMGPKCL